LSCFLYLSKGYQKLAQTWFARVYIACLQLGDKWRGGYGSDLRDKQASVPEVPELLRNDLLAVAVWYIWWERRQVSHGETIQSPPRIAHAILTLTLNYSRVQKKKEGIVRYGWVRPREDFVKLNVDVGFSADSGMGSTGAIIREESGRFIAANCRGLSFLSDAATAEVTALRDGLILAAK
jgi:hypothetical protein